MVIFHCYVSLPEGKHLKSAGFDGAHRLIPVSRPRHQGNISSRLGMRDFPKISARVPQFDPENCSVLICFVCLLVYVSLKGLVLKYPKSIQVMYRFVAHGDGKIAQEKPWTDPFGASPRTDPFCPTLVVFSRHPSHKTWASPCFTTLTVCKIGIQRCRSHDFFADPFVWKYVYCTILYICFPLYTMV